MGFASDDELIDALRQRGPGYDMLHPGAPVPQREPPFDLGEKDAIEAKLGHPLPDIYLRCCGEIGNGGFGPGHGLLGLGTNGFADEDGRTTEALYALFRNDPVQPPQSGMA